MNALAKAEPALRLRHKFTLDDVFRMQEAGIISHHDRLQLIEGELVPMAAQNAPHMLGKQALARLLFPLEPAISFHIDGTLRLSAQSAPDPDIFVHAPDLRPDRVRGPDALLVIEVSDTTLNEDLGEMAALYARYDVPEFWVLDVNGRRLYVHREPRSEGYAWRKIVEGDELVSPERIPELRVRMSELPEF